MNNKDKIIIHRVYRKLTNSPIYVFTKTHMLLAYFTSGFNEKSLILLQMLEITVIHIAQVFMREIGKLILLKQSTDNYCTKLSSYNSYEVLNL